MCEFVSFIVTSDGRILAGYLTSHSGVAAAYGVAPGQYREAEWTRDDDGASLVVRAEPGETDDDRIEWREKVLRRHPNRASLLSGITEGRQADHRGVTVFRYRNGKRHRVDGPAVERADGSREWYLDDKLHRVDGPAVECADGWCEWWEDGDYIRSAYVGVGEGEPC